MRDLCRPIDAMSTWCAWSRSPATSSPSSGPGSSSGRYHVLQGAIDHLQGVGPEQLRIRELLARVTTEGITEIIICTNPNLEGEATALYLTKVLAVPGLIVTRIASGLPGRWRPRVRRRADPRPRPRGPAGRRAPRPTTVSVRVHGAPRLPTAHLVRIALGADRRLQPGGARRRARCSCRAPHRSSTTGRAPRTRPSQARRCIEIIATALDRCGRFDQGRGPDADLPDRRRRTSSRSRRVHGEAFHDIRPANTTVVVGGTARPALEGRDRGRGDHPQGTLADG